MAKYATRTCHSCGVKKPQPEMYEDTIQVKTGSSKRGLTGREVLGAVAGSDKSRNSIQNFVFAPNKREYTRTRKVWLCGDCNSNTNKEKSTGMALVILAIFFGGIYYGLSALVANLG